MAKFPRFNIRNALQVIAGAGVFTLFVFATETKIAPTTEAGIILTALVYILTLVALLGIFRKQALFKALQHLLVATPVALTIALIGGVFWVGDPITKLLSMEFFTSVSIVAFWVGLFGGSIADAKTR